MYLTFQKAKFFCSISAFYYTYLKNGKSGRNLSKKYRYGWYLHDKEIVAVQVNKTYKR